MKSVLRIITLICSCGVLIYFFPMPGTCVNRGLESSQKKRYISESKAVISHMIENSLSTNYQTINELNFKTIEGIFNERFPKEYLTEMGLNYDGGNGIFYKNHDIPYLRISITANSIHLEELEPLK